MVTKWLGSTGTQLFRQRPDSVSMETVKTQTCTTAVLNSHSSPENLQIDSEKHVLFALITLNHAALMCIHSTHSVIRSLLDKSAVGTGHTGPRLVK